MAVRPQGRNQTARRVPHEDERLVVALGTDQLDGLADLLVVHRQVVRVSNGLVGTQGTPVLAHVERVERGTRLPQTIRHLRLEEVIVAPVQVQDRHVGALGRGCAHEGRDAGPLSVVEQLNRARLVALTQDIGTPLKPGRASLAPGGHHVALGEPLQRRGLGIHPGQVGQAARVRYLLAIGRGIAGNAHGVSITREATPASSMRRRKRVGSRRKSADQAKEDAREGMRSLRNSLRRDVSWSCSMRNPSWP